jgi:two-component sensor histidine kinase
MGVYLTTLTTQIAASYTTDLPVRLIVEANGVLLDLPRATPCGLIINELVTNSYKYAFPESSGCRSSRSDPCTIRVSLVLEDGHYLLAIGDNGIGFPAAFDPRTAKSLGLKLVNFLAQHQLRATIAVRSDRGTCFTFRFAADAGGK